LAFSFSNDPDVPNGTPGNSPAGDVDATEAAPSDQATPAVPPSEPTPPTASEAVLRFRSCRWYQAPEGGNSEFCTHREVKPYAGTNDFDAEAWCPDCKFFKLRRTPKKRSRDEFGY
jgi:hypothetical protein